MTDTEMGRRDAGVTALASAVRELRDAVETLAGVIDLGAEEVFVRSNLDKASQALAVVERELHAS